MIFKVFVIITILFITISCSNIPNMEIQLHVDYYGFDKNSNFIIYNTKENKQLNSQLSYLRDSLVQLESRDSVIRSKFDTLNLFEKIPFVKDTMKIDSTLYHFELIDYSYNRTSKNYLLVYNLFDDTPRKVSYNNGHRYTFYTYYKSLDDEFVVVDKKQYNRSNKYYRTTSGFSIDGKKIYYNTENELIVYSITTGLKDKCEKGSFVYSPKNSDDLLIYDVDKKQYSLNDITFKSPNKIDRIYVKDFFKIDNHKYLIVFGWSRYLGKTSYDELYLLDFENQKSNLLLEGHEKYKILGVKLL